jgi:predicted RNA methylase
MPAKIKLTDEVKAILARSTWTIKGTMHVLNLPDALPRPQYDAVMKIIKAAEGKWKRGTGHVFSSDPRMQFDLAAESGIMVDRKVVRQAFYTPAHVAQWVADLADVTGEIVLEPSAGDGALVRACVDEGAHHVDAVEIDENTAAGLRGSGFARYVKCADFLTLSAPVADDALYARIVMNPPFTKNQDKKHLERALAWLTPGGVITALTADKDIVVQGGQVELLQRIRAGEFKESGTNIATRIIQIRHA